jgi:hypothetical protein
LFEGEYKNWKRYKGKEYKNNEIIFEGEYIDGKRYKGREYKKYNFGKKIIDIVFKGEYRNRKKWEGKQIEYDKVNKKEFEYDYENGQKISIQKMNTGMALNLFKKDLDNISNIKMEASYNDSNEIISKEIKNNELNQTNKTIIKENNIVQNFNKVGELIFSGEYKDNMKYKGFQREYTRFGELFFNGYFQDNKKSYGIEFDKNAITLFEGEFKDNKRYKGKEFNQKGEIIFEGIYNNEGEKWDGTGYNRENKFNYVEGKIEGNVVTYDYINHELFEGEYKNGEKLNGKLKTYFDSKNFMLKREITLKNGKSFGKGKEYFKNKKLKYIGEFQDDYYHGEGKLYYEFTGYINYIGEFKKGKKHGKGKEFDIFGNIINEGNFNNGKYLQ